MISPLHLSEKPPAAGPFGLSLMHIRWLLLLFILLAFARVCWRLDANDMWWDESLSLQRAEADWVTLLRGTLTMHDGFNLLPTTDQHPFFFFVIQGLLVRVAGISEFVLRYPSALAATLLVPVVWVLARYFVRREILPKTAAVWAAGYAALHPFFLWFGQEARPYALWAVLSLLAIYLLFRATDGRVYRSWLVGYIVVTCMAIVTHYYAIFWLPLHAIHLYGWLIKRSRWLGPTVAILLMALGGAIGGAVAWQIFSQGGGGNFPDISLKILVPDLVNAFSLGLSVTLDDAVHWLGWLFGALALLGALWALRSRQSILAGGWLLPTSLLIPVTIVLLVSMIQPAYMNARHLSLLGGTMIILVGGGMALLWQRQRWATAVLACVLTAGLLYSTANYFTQPAFGKDQYSAMGRYLRNNLLPNDVVLISPPFSWRIFDYYLPLAEIDAARQQGVHVAYYGAPLLNVEWSDNEQLFRTLQQQYRRIWLARSGTHPYLDPEGKVPHWLRDNNTMRLQEEKFFSPTSFLDLELFLTQPPVYEGMDPPVQQSSDVRFGELLHLVGYDIDAPMQPGSALPITLYWQVQEKPTVRYKYILQLILLAEGDAGAANSLATADVLVQTEMEPYYGQIPTTYWDPGKTIIDYTALPPITLDPNLAPRYRLTLQLYAAESLEKLSASATGDVVLTDDGQQAVLPFIVP
ncbi:MAG: glycosyltransferase family 39 protein [Caldilineaceae bacterium]